MAQKTKIAKGKKPVRRRPPTTVGYIVANFTPDNRIWPLFYHRERKAFFIGRSWTLFPTRSRALRALRHSARYDVRTKRGAWQGQLLIERVTDAGAER